MLEQLIHIIESNQGMILCGSFFIIVIILFYAMHRADRKSLEDFYRRYPKYDPRKKKTPKDSAFWI